MKELIEKTVHDIRSPLACIQAGACGLDKILAGLILAYREAQKHGLNIPKINEEILNSAEKINKNIEKSSFLISDYLNEILEGSKQCE